MRILRVLAAVILTQAVTGSGEDRAPSAVRLIADVESIKPGVPFLLGVQIILADDWHTYWVNPGDTGMPPDMQWSLPPGFEAGDVLWPMPKRFIDPPLISFGYDQQVTFYREIRPSADIEMNRDYAFAVDASWLICKEVCIPQAAKLQINLPAREQPPLKDAKSAPLLAKAAANIPAVDETWRFHVLVAKEAVTLIVSPPAGVAVKELDKAEFFPIQPNVVGYKMPRWSVVGNEGRLRLPLVPGADKLTDHLRGVLVLPEGLRKGVNALEVRAAVKAQTKE